MNKAVVVGGVALGTGLLIYMATKSSAQQPPPGGGFIFSVKITNINQSLHQSDGYSCNWQRGNPYPDSGYSILPLTATSVFHLANTPGVGKITVGLYLGDILTAVFDSNAFIPINGHTYTVDCTTGIVS